MLRMVINVFIGVYFIVQQRNITKENLKRQTEAALGGISF